jgi:hypothetical protein
MTRKTIKKQNLRFEKRIWRLVGIDLIIGIDLIEGEGTVSIQ